MALLDQLSLQAPRLRPDERRHLVAAVTAGDALLIRYRNESGNESERVVSDLTLSGGYLIGHCHLRHGERYFRVDRITLVAPVG